jgi:hypothetical protein
MNTESDHPAPKTAAQEAFLRVFLANEREIFRYVAALASDVELAPGLDQFTMDSEAPAQPDPEDRYPVAMPGFTKVL